MTFSFIAYHTRTVNVHIMETSIQESGVAQCASYINAWQIMFTTELSL